MNALKLLLLVLAAALAACATEPPQYGEVVTMKAGAQRRRIGYPPPGTVWRLEESDLKASPRHVPRPTLEPPPPPRPPPPSARRVTTPPPPPAYYYGPPPGYQSGITGR